MVLLQECLPEQAHELGATLEFASFHAVVRGRPRQRAVLAAPGWSVGDLSPVEIPCAYARPESPRFALVCVVEGPEGAFRLVNSHLSLDAESRLASCSVLDGLAGDGFPTVLAGDMNEGPEGPAIRSLCDGGWIDAWSAVRPEEQGLTAYNPDCDVRIDFVLCSKELVALDATLLGVEPDADGVYPSDHAGLVVEVGIAY